MSDSLIPRRHDPSLRRRPLVRRRSRDPADTTGEQAGVCESLGFTDAEEAVAVGKEVVVPAEGGETAVVGAKERKTRRAGTERVRVIGGGE